MTEYARCPECDRYLGYDIVRQKAGEAARIAVDALDSAIAAMSREIELCEREAVRLRKDKLSGMADRKEKQARRLQSQAGVLTNSVRPLFRTELKGNDTA